MLQRIWAKEYSNGVHFSTVKKDGFTAFVPESLALAMFLRAQLALLDEETLVEDEIRKLHERNRRMKQRRKRKRT